MTLKAHISVVYQGDEFDAAEFLIDTEDPNYASDSDCAEMLIESMKEKYKNILESGDVFWDYVTIEDVLQYLENKEYREVACIYLDETSYVYVVEIGMSRETFNWNLTR